MSSPQPYFSFHALPEEGEFRLHVPGTTYVLDREDALKLLTDMAGALGMEVRSPDFWKRWDDALETAKNMMLAATKERDATLARGKELEAQLAKTTPAPSRLLTIGATGETIPYTGGNNVIER